MFTPARALRCAATKLAHGPSLVGLTHYGPGLSSGPMDVATSEEANMVGMTNRGVKNSNCIAEPNTAVYDGVVPWTYFQPMKVNIEKLGAPEAKYYQRLTKKHWDISATEWMELTYRKRFVLACWWGSLWFCMMFVFQKEKQYNGLKGSDGHWIFIPRNQPELY